MIKYKLIKEYPGSHPKGSVSKLDYSNYPDFWQKVEELDYEILSFKNINSGSLVDLHSNNLYCCKESDTYKGIGVETKEDCMSKESLCIHSVRRLSDGEVFTIGDSIDFEDFGNKGNQPIEKIEIDYFDNTRITAWDGPYGIGISKWKNQSIKNPLFTTEDGVDIFEGDDFFFPNTHVWVISKTKADTKMIHHVIEVNKYKTFSNKEKAEEYLLLNKPCLSIQEVKNIMYKDRCFFATHLKSLVKSKL